MAYYSYLCTRKANGTRQLWERDNDTKGAPRSSSIADGTHSFLDMVTRVVIRDNKKSPVGYLSKLENFANGQEYIFKPGVNVIIGENGSGKTTLMKLLEAYLMVGYGRCERGIYNKNVSRVMQNGDKVPDGVDVYADYTKNTFRLSHSGECEGEEAMRNRHDFAALVGQKSSSTGEGVVVALNSLFEYMFGKDAELMFDYDQFKEGWTAPYFDYTEKHRVTCADEWTILMDEPDRNLSLENIKHIKGILSFHKPNTQIIAVVHNPLLIYALSRKKCVNIIEMTAGYVDRVRNEINNLIR